MNRYEVTDNTDPMLTMVTSIQDIYHQIFPLSPNFRSLAIFTCYIILATALTISILYTIFSQTQLSSNGKLPKPKLLIYGVITVVSIGTKWSHMLSFLDLSYTTWASSHNVHVSDVQLGAWLKDTKLVEQAWDAVCSTPERYWWTHQILLYITIWSLFVGHEGTHTWNKRIINRVLTCFQGENIKYRDYGDSCWWARWSRYLLPRVYFS